MENTINLLGKQECYKFICEKFDYSFIPDIDKCCYIPGGFFENLVFVVKGLQFSFTFNYPLNILRVVESDFNTLETISLNEFQLSQID